MAKVKAIGKTADEKLQNIENAVFENTNRDPVEVQNKDIPLLADVLYVMQEICQIEKRREWQKDRLFSISQHLTGMPGGSGTPKGLDEAFAALSEIDTEHEKKCKDYMRKLRKAQKILNGIESQSMRTFVQMKYVMDLPDTEIRKELNLSKHGFYRARQCIESAPCMAAVKWQERYILVDK